VYTGRILKFETRKNGGLVMFKSCVVNSKIGANRNGAAFSIFFYFRGRKQGSFKSMDEIAL
jgi:hypothetical protein